MSSFLSISESCLVYIRDTLIDLHFGSKSLLAVIYVPTETAIPWLFWNSTVRDFYLKEEEVNVGSDCLLALNYIKHLLCHCPYKQSN